MNRTLLGPRALATATVAIGGVLLVVYPQHVLSIVQLTFVSAAATSVLYLLDVVAPPSWWTSPFEVVARSNAKPALRDELRFIRSTFSGRRQAMPYGPALPPETLRLLRPLIGVALSRRHLDPRDPRHRERARALVSPQTWAVWSTEPSPVVGWWRTRMPNRALVARIVVEVLDDLERLEPADSSFRAHE